MKKTNPTTGRMTPKQELRFLIEFLKEQTNTGGLCLDDWRSILDPGADVLGAAGIPCSGEVLAEPIYRHSLHVVLKQLRATNPDLEREFQRVKSEHNPPPQRS